MKYFLKGDYYFDIDLMNQLRIAGPLNHLLLGLSFPSNIKVEVQSYELVDGQLRIVLLAHADKLTLTLPLVTDMRTLRSYTEPVTPTPSYGQLVDQGINDVLPQKVEKIIKENHTYISCTNSYVDEQQVTQSYGALIGVESNSEIKVKNHYLHITGESPIIILVETHSTINVEDPLSYPVFRPSAELPEKIFPAELREIYQFAGEQIEHLIRTKKTSGFEYGTIFPRDWIESADLGSGDLSQETVDYMYKQSMMYVSDQGEGWHEDIVGQYKTRVADTLLHIDRKMIDIEPRYILGFRVLSTSFLMADDIRAKMKRIAKYIIRTATENDLITFKRVANHPEHYHFIGNWRDSYHAFPRQKSPLGPYDVNCVLYPEALRIIADHVDYFEVDKDNVFRLIHKWDQQKNKFRLYHPGDLIGYSLAVHGKKRLPLPIAHTDEAYDLFYNSASMEEVISFAKKLMNEEFFYTPVGPTLVARDEEDFSVRQYHGKVIWPKQSAYCVAGLTQQYFRGITEGWPAQVLDQIKQSALATAETSFAAFVQLQAIPELYYYDEATDGARLYTDQAEYEGQMSIIQLWSSVGCRRMMRDYAAIKGYKLT